jgi:signal transduction histidine kinase
MTFPQLPALLEVLTRVNGSYELPKLLEAVLIGARELMNGEASTLWLYDAQRDVLEVHTAIGEEASEVRGLTIPRGKGIGWWVFLNRKPYLTNDAQNDPLFSGEIVGDGFTTRNLFTVPLINAAGDAIGVLQVLNHPEGFSEEMISLFTVLAQQAAVAIERERLRETIRVNEEKSRRLLQASEAASALAFARGVEEERARIARELHDGILGSLSRIIRGLQPVFQKHGISPDWLNQIQQTSADIRDVMNDLRPRILEHFGLFAALESLVREACEKAVPPIIFRFQQSGDDPPLEEFKKVFLYRVFQEAVANVMQHAGASKVELRLKSDENGLEIILADNGKGFDAASAPSNDSEMGTHGHGLNNMAYRIKMISGSLAIQSQPGRGTEIVVRVPFSAEK